MIVFTLMHVQSENGSVIKSNIAAKNVRTNAQNPGPSGSAETKKKRNSKYLIVIIRFSGINE